MLRKMCDSLLHILLVVCVVFCLQIYCKPPAGSVAKRLWLWVLMLSIKKRSVMHNLNNTEAKLVGYRVRFLLQLFHFCLIGVTLIFQNSAIFSAQKAFSPTVVSSQYTLWIPEYCVTFLLVLYIFFVFLSRFLLQRNASKSPSPHTALPF